MKCYSKCDKPTEWYVQGKTTSGAWTNLTSTVFAGEQLNSGEKETFHMKATSLTNIRFMFPAIYFGIESIDFMCTRTLCTIPKQRESQFNFIMLLSYEIFLLCKSI